MLQGLRPDFSPLSDDFAAAGDFARALLIVSPT
jgi:hypothetical protein